MSDTADYSSQKRPEMIAFLPQQRDRVLEIGCARGEFLPLVPGVKEAWGIEPSPNAEVAEKRMHRIFQATFDEAEAHLPLNYFDVIVCNDVIEHMPDHDAFLARVGKHLVSNGVIVGSIPNVRFYDNLFKMLVEKDWNYRDAGTLDRTHLRFFTEKSLKASLAKHGFLLKKFEGLTTNIMMSGSRRDRVYYWLSRILMLGTFGYYNDIRYLQFGFQATWQGSNKAPEQSR